MVETTPAPLGPFDHHADGWRWDPLPAVAYDTALAAIHHVVTLCTALLHRDPARFEDLKQVKSQAIATRRTLRADDSDTVADAITRYADVARELAPLLGGDL